jgi:hypothetical protein
MEMQSAVDRMIKLAVKGVELRIREQISIRDILVKIQGNIYNCES